MTVYTFITCLTVTIRSVVAIWGLYKAGVKININKDKGNIKEKNYIFFPNYLKTMCLYFAKATFKLIITLYQNNFGILLPI